MVYTRLPSIQHVAKAIRPTVEETERELHRLDGGMPPFSYNLSWRVAPALYSGELSLAAALAAAKRLQVPVGVRSNAEVIEIIWRDAQGAQDLCRPLSDRDFQIRKDLAIPVKPKFFFVRDGKVYIYWLQPWKRFELTQEQLGLLASVIKMTFIRDDFSEADLHLLDTSADSEYGMREPKVLHLNDLPLLSEEKLTAALGRFASAYDRFVANRKPQRDQTRGSRDLPQPDLFDL